MERRNTSTHRKQYVDDEESADLFLREQASLLVEIFGCGAPETPSAYFARSRLVVKPRRRVYLHPRRFADGDHL